MKNIVLSLIFVFATTCTFAQKSISVDSAAAYIGETVTICTKVYGIKAFDKVTLLNVGAAFPKSPLTIAISATDIANFETPLEKYNGQQICVTGKVLEFKGKPEIVVTKQDQITFVGPDAILEKK
jgi:DNA/RNA endonuclease YhcR with UshA esterase domain